MKSECAASGNGMSIQPTLDRLCRLEEDITPKVFGRYIEKFPESGKLFRLLAHGQPPLGCGQMLFEILSVLDDLTKQASYVDGYLKDLMTGHLGFGVRSLDLYLGFLDVIAETVAVQLGESWPQVERQAWTRATWLLKSRLKQLSAGLLSQSMPDVSRHMMTAQ